MSDEADSEDIVEARQLLARDRAEEFADRLSTTCFAWVAAKSREIEKRFGAFPGVAFPTGLFLKNTKVGVRKRNGDAEKKTASVGALATSETTKECNLFA
jgi:hypothetical protein